MEKSQQIDDSKAVFRKYLLITLAAMLLSFSGYAQAKKFNWVSWKRISLNTDYKNRLKLFKINKTESLYYSIMQAVNEAKAMGGHYEVMVAAIDLDGDGSVGYAVAYSGSYFCGTSGCPIEVYEKDGAKTLTISDMWSDIKPAKNGVITSTGKFVPLTIKK